MFVVLTTPKDYPLQPVAQSKKKQNLTRKDNVENFDPLDIFFIEFVQNHEDCREQKNQNELALVQCVSFPPVDKEEHEQNPHEIRKC